MARKKRDVASPRARRVRTPREKKPKTEVLDVEDRTWAVRSKHRAMAVEILNRSNSFPWWASVDKPDRCSPVSGYFPSCHFDYAGRTYLGFAFRHHRDEYVEYNIDSRKEYTEPTLNLFRSMRR